MKNMAKKFLATLLSAVTVIAVVPFIVSNIDATDYAVGDIIEFGSYPQSEVTDEETLTALNSQKLNWVSYGYYSGDGNGSYGSMIASDYMRYADEVYDGNKYRAVTFEFYRPWWTEEKSTTDTAKTSQDDNGYYINTVYWFKYESIEWRVLDPETGLIICETIIDSQAYSNTIYEGENLNGEDSYWNDEGYTNYANDYATSSIRKWLNDDFYNTAFTSEQKSKIELTTLDNSAYTNINNECYSKYYSASTTDKIFLLSYDEAINSDYGFSSIYSDSDKARRAKGSDYAKCQGLTVSPYTDGFTYWRLCSASINGTILYDTNNVSNYGDINNGTGVHYTNIGIRPALRISDFSSSNQKPTESAIQPTTTPTTESATTPDQPEEPTTRPTQQTTTKPTEPSTTKPESTTIPEDEVKIKKPSQTEITYGDSIVLHVDVDLPAGAKVVWKPSNENFSCEVSADGKTCTISPEKSGDTKFTAYVVDENGNVISEEYSQTMTSKAGFFQKIIAFFKKLFGLTKTIPQMIDGIK